MNLAAVDPNQGKLTDIFLKKYFPPPADKPAKRKGKAASGTDEEEIQTQATQMTSVAPSFEELLQKSLSAADQSLQEDPSKQSATDPKQKEAEQTRVKEQEERMATLRLQMRILNARPSL